MTTLWRLGGGGTILYELFEKVRNYEKNALIHFAINDKIDAEKFVITK